jgi:hypothetical protein
VPFYLQFHLFFVRPKIFEIFFRVELRRKVLHVRGYEQERASFGQIPLHVLSAKTSELSRERRSIMNFVNSEDFPAELTTSVTNLEHAVTAMEACVEKLIAVPLTETHKQVGC